MFSMLEKLVNEHGSANILKERLGLKDDQITALQKEYADLMHENSALKAENSNLSEELSKAHDEINTLKASASSGDQSGEAGALSDTESQILQWLFDTDAEVSAHQVAQQFGFKIGNVEYHLNNLLEQEYIYDLLSAYGHTYHIDANGRKYIVENT